MKVINYFIEYPYLLVSIVFAIMSFRIDRVLSVMSERNKKKSGKI